MALKKILIVVAHADDETIGMGGTISKHIKKGDSVNVISMTNGVAARDLADENDIQNRKLASEKASQILGFHWFKCFDFPDNAMDSCTLISVIKSIESVKEKCKPDIVYTHSSSDLNIDHRIISNAVLTAFRPQPGEICKEIRLFEVASSTDYGHDTISGRFSPNLFISIIDTWQDKLKALEAYSYEMKLYPHSRSIKGIENLAKLRGNQNGLAIAEAFQVVRKIEI